MTTTVTLQRTLAVVLTALAMMLPATAVASASPSIPSDVVVVSSTDLESGSFTMTATNLGEDSVGLELPAPGAATGVSVDTGSYGEYWTIDDLASGVTATMTGILLR